MKFQIDFGRKTNKSDELTLSVAENSRICDNPHENLPTQVQNCANSTAAQSLCSEISVTVPQMTARPGRNRVPGMVSMDDLMNMSFDDMKSHMHSTPHASFRSTRYVNIPDSRFVCSFLIIAPRRGWITQSVPLRNLMV